MIEATLLARIGACMENLKRDDVSTIATKTFRDRLTGVLGDARAVLESARPPDPKTFGHMFLRETGTPRVVTVGWFRSNEGDAKLHMAFAVNRVHRASVAYARDHYQPKWHLLDTFDRDVGRDKVHLRLLLEPNAHVIRLDEGEKTKAAILRYAKSAGSAVPSTVARVIRRSL